MEAALSLLGSRRWTRRHRKAAQLQFDAYARKQEPAYHEQAARQLRIEKEECVRLARITLQETPKGLSVRGGPGRARERNLHHRTKDLVTEDSLRAFQQRLGRAYTQYHQDWFDRFLALNTETATQVGTRIATETGVAFDVIDPWLRTFSMEATNRLAGNVPDATYHAIVDSILKGRENGEGIDRLTRRVRNVFDKGYTYKTKKGVTRVISAKHRARLIARTETTYLSNGASLTGMLRGGQEDLYLKSWISQGDDRVRQTHLDEEADSADGIPLKDSFPVTGLDFPGEPNCRCTLFYIPKKEAPKPRTTPPPAAPEVPVRPGLTPAQVKELEKWHDITPEHAQELMIKLDRIDNKYVELGKRLERRRLAVAAQRDELLNGLVTPAVEKQFEDLGKVQKRLLKRWWDLEGRWHNAQMQALRPPVPRKGIKPKFTNKAFIKERADEAATWLEKNLHPATTRKQMKLTQLTDIDDRAFFHSDWGGTNASIYVTKADGVDVLVHEFAHSLEDKWASVLKQSVQWRDRRAIETLLELDPAKVPKSKWTELLKPAQQAINDLGEMGYPCNFYNEYVGRTYYAGEMMFEGNTATEVLSMGMQAMFENPSSLAWEDFDHFLYTLRYMNGNHIPMKRYMSAFEP